MLDPGGEDDGKAGAVGDVVVGAELVLDDVAGPVLGSAGAEQSVVGDARGVHHFGPGVIVLALSRQLAPVQDDGAQSGLREPVDEVGAGGLGEIALHDMGHDVADAVADLGMRQGETELGIEDAEDRTEQGRGGGIFPGGFFVGDHRIRAALAARGGNGQDGPEGHRLLAAGFAGVEIPDLALVRDAHGDGFGGIDGTPAPDREDEIDLLFSRQLDALVDQREARIGFHSAQFDELDARLFKGCRHLIVNAGPLDALSAVMEQHLAAAGFDLGARLAMGAPAEDHFGGILIFKIEHGPIPWF